MNEKQKQIIKKEVESSDWLQPASQDVEVYKIMFDVYKLLPDENVEAYLRDCPKEAYWSYLGCDESGNDWYFMPPAERRLWVSIVTINRQDRIKNIGKIEELKIIKVKQAMKMLFIKITELTDYTNRKTKEELQQMLDEAERIKQAGPPKRSL